MVWPPNIPSLSFGTNLRETEADHVIRTQVSSGPPKVRLKVKTPAYLEFTLLMTQAETNVFKTFYTTTISYGSKSFTAIHPLTNRETTFRIVDPPVYINVSGAAIFRVSLKLEVL